MDQALKDFINKRIDSNYDRLRQDKEWNTTNEEYKQCYDKLYHNLQGEQKEQLDNIIDLKNNLIDYESIFSYKIGANDMLKLFKL